MERRSSINQDISEDHPEDEEEDEEEEEDNNREMGNGSSSGMFTCDYGHIACLNPRILT